MAPVERDALLLRGAGRRRSVGASRGVPEATHRPCPG